MVWFSTAVRNDRNKKKAQSKDVSCTSTETVEELTKTEQELIEAIEKAHSDTFPLICDDTEMERVCTLYNKIIYFVMKSCTSNCHSRPSFIIVGQHSYLFHIYRIITTSVMVQFNTFEVDDGVKYSMFWSFLLTSCRIHVCCC